MSEENSVNQTRAQYEQLPYPPRSPEDERSRLVRTSLDYLPKLSYYCFNGNLELNRSFKILVAGGGTGDSAIYLAEQTRDSGVQIDYLDISKQSLKIAQARANIRELKNIRFQLGSILDAHHYYSEPFDYINCSGVLHHLKNPDAGLKALTKLLKPNGAIGIMVYAQYGRTAVYQIQNLLRKITGETAIEYQIELAKAMVEQLPETNWFNRSQDLHTDHLKHGNAGFADLLLSPCDRAYTVPDLHQWIKNSDLQFVEYASNRLHYKPEMYISDQELLQAIELKSSVEKQAIAELISGTMIKHTFYAAFQYRNPAELNLDATLIPAQEIDIEKVLNEMSKIHIGKNLSIETHDSKLNLPINPISQLFFLKLKEKTDLHDIIKFIQNHSALTSFPAEWIHNQIFDLCKLLIGADMLYCVNKSEIYY